MAPMLLLSVSIVVLLSWVAVKIAYSIWWVPRQYTEALERQGIHGCPYKLIVGNVRKEASMQNQARSEPMSFSHDIVSRVFPFFQEAVEKYGKISLTWLGKTPQLILTDPGMVKEVISNKFGHFQKPALPPALRTLALGLASSEGERWAVKRKLLNPAFHLEKLKGMLPSFSSSCIELVQRWEKSIGPQGSCEWDVWVEFQNLTGDIISRAAFSSNYEEGKHIFQMLREQADLLIQAFPTLCIPGFRFLPTKKNLRMKELDRKVLSLLNNIIEKREKEMQLGIANNNDLLGILLESNKNNLEYGNRGITRDEIIEECKLFYAAGQETTAGFLTWTMVLLSMHPSWQMRARDEVLQVCGKCIPSFDCLVRLKTISMILYEVLRLYPPVTFTARHTCKTTKVGDVTLPSGVQLMLPILMIHHDRKFWGDDADEFKPERFSEGVANASKHQLAFFPFGWGHRICIGQTFALIEAKMTLAMILQHFSFELSPSYAHAPHKVLTLQPQYGAQIVLQTV